MQREGGLSTIYTAIRCLFSLSVMRHAFSEPAPWSSMTDKYRSLAPLRPRIGGVWLQKPESRWSGFVSTGSFHSAIASQGKKHEEMQRSSDCSRGASSMISRASLKVLSDSSLGALTNPPPLSETRNGPHAMYAIPHGFDELRWLPRTTQRARYAAAACSLDDSGMTSPVASLNGAAYGRDHIVPSADRNKIVEIQSASTQSKWRTLRLGKEDLNSRFELLVLPHLDSAYNLARWLLRD